MLRPAVDEGGGAVRALLGKVFAEWPLRFYRYADTGSGGARLLGIVMVVGGLGAGAALGSGFAWAIHRDVGDGALVGMMVGAGLVGAFMLLTLSLVAGEALAERFGGRGRSGRHGDEPLGSTPTALWAVIAFFGIVGSFVAVVTVLSALAEAPYRGPRAETVATVVGWRDGRDGRVFTVQYDVDGATRTGTVAIDDNPDLTIDSAVGDRTLVEYQVGDPARVRGAGQAAEMRSSVVISAWVSAGLLAVALVAMAIAVRLWPRGRTRRRPATR